MNEELRQAKQVVRAGIATPHKLRHKFVQFTKRTRAYWRCTKCRQEFKLTGDEYCFDPRAWVKCPGRPKPKDPHGTRKVVKVFVDIGSHGHVYGFQGGMVGERYPNLMQVYSKPGKHLVPATLTYTVPIK